MPVAAIVPRVREALGVSADYDAVTIPALIRRCIQRLLRDYHFPKSVVRTEFTNLFLNSQEFSTPAGFKKELRVQLYDPTDKAWSDPLRKSEGFRRPQSGGYPLYYWLEGTKLWLDTPLPTDMVGFTLQLFHESVLVSANEGWFTEDFEDVTFTFSVFRGAAEMRKPEVMAAYAPLWEDERKSLAIYANELEFGNLHMQMREPTEPRGERYPRS